MTRLVDGGWRRGSTEGEARRKVSLGESGGLAEKRGLGGRVGGEKEKEGAGGWIGGRRWFWGRRESVQGKARGSIDSAARVELRLCFRAVPCCVPSLRMRRGRIFSSPKSSLSRARLCLQLCLVPRAPSDTCGIPHGVVCTHTCAERATNVKIIGRGRDGKVPPCHRTPEF